MMGHLLSGNKTQNTRLQSAQATSEGCHKVVTSRFLTVVSRIVGAATMSGVPARHCLSMTHISLNFNI